MKPGRVLEHPGTPQSSGRNGLGELSIFLILLIIVTIMSFKISVFNCQTMPQAMANDCNSVFNLNKNGVGQNSRDVPKIKFVQVKLKTYAVLL